MKVLHVLPAIAPELGGPSEVALCTVRELRRVGIDAEIVCTSWGVTGVEASGALEEFEGVPVRFFRPTLISHRQYIPSTDLYRFLHQNVARYDIVDLHYLFTFSTSVAAAACRRLKVPYTVRLMGQLDRWTRRFHGYRKEIYLRMIDRRLFSGAKFVQCTSSMEIEDARAQKIPNLVTVPLAIAPAPQPLSMPREDLRRRLNIPVDAPILLYLSRIHEKKRPDRSVSLLAGIQNLNPHLIIAGPGKDSLRAALVQQATQAGVAQRLHVLPHVGTEDRELLLQGSDLMVLLSESENFGMVVGEAAMRGLPAIISRGVGLQDWVIGHAPELVVDDEGSGVNVAQRLLSDPVHRQRIGTQLREAAQRELSWEEAVSSLIQKYREGVGRR